MVLSTSYHPNNTPKAVTPYENWDIQGERQTFLPGGEPNTLEQWRQGYQHGPTVVFQNGEKYSELPYVKGKRQGLEKCYRNGDTLIEEFYVEQRPTTRPVLYVYRRHQKNRLVFPGSTGQ